jgi:hypothetical protein
MSNWRKSSYSGDGGSNCVEVSGDDSRVLVRDTKDKSELALRFSTDAWRRFAERVKKNLASNTHPTAVPRS